MYVRLDPDRRMIDVGVSFPNSEEFGGWLDAAQAREMAAELIRVAGELDALGTANASPKAN